MACYATGVLLGSLRRGAVRHEAAQGFAAAMQAGHDGADGDVEHRGDVLVVQALEADEQHHLALRFRQQLQRTRQVADLEAAFLARRGRHLRLVVIKLLSVGTRPALALIVDVNVVQDREHPGPDVGSGLPKMAARQPSDQGFLHQVVRPYRIAEQSPRVAS